MKILERLKYLYLPINAGLALALATFLVGAFLAVVLSLEIPQEAVLLAMLVAFCIGIVATAYKMPKAFSKKFLVLNCSVFLAGLILCLGFVAAHFYCGVDDATCGPRVEIKIFLISLALGLLSFFTLSRNAR